MLHWNGIDTVFFDMDGTIIDLDFENTFWDKVLPQSYAKSMSISLQESKDQIKQYADTIHGTLNWYCLDHWDHYLQIDTLSLMKTISYKLKFLPYALEFFMALNQHLHVKKAILTNAHPRNYYFKDNQIKLGKYFDFVVSSHEYGMPKEDPKFWERLDAEHPFDKRRTLLIEDNIHVLQSAKQYGIQHLLVINQPDTTKKVHTIEDFNGITNFKSLLPII